MAKILSIGGICIGTLAFMKHRWVHSGAEGAMKIALPDSNRDLSWQCDIKEGYLWNKLLFKLKTMHSKENGSKQIHYLQMEWIFFRNSREQKLSTIQSNLSV